jgi:hypothetical protein
MKNRVNERVTGTRGVLGERERERACVKRSVEDIEHKRERLWEGSIMEARERV